MLLKIIFQIVTGGGSSSTPSPSPDPDNVNYLYFKNIGSSNTTFQLCKDGSPSSSIAFECSKDKINWSTLPLDENIPVLVGETIYIKAKNNNPYLYDPEGSNGFYFYSSATNSDSLEVGGSIMTLLDPTDLDRDLSGKDYCFYYLFYEMINLKNADNLVCPATKLAPCCYQYLFCYCSSLQSVNENLLPATDLTGADYCYYYMFYDCEELQNAPKLPATTLSNYCYKYMFEYCYALENAPLLPATELTEGCYYGIFCYCTSLNNVEVCFSNFNSLPTYATDYWLYDVATSGTFKWPGGTIGVPTGDSYIPSGWTISNLT